MVYARHDLIGDKHRFIYPDSSITRTRQRIRDEHQQALHSIDPLQLLEEPEVQKRVCLPIGQQDRLNLGARLPVDLLDQRELLRRYQVRALVALRMRVSVKRCSSRKTAGRCSTSHGTGFARILFELSSRKTFETSEMDIVAFDRALLPLRETMSAVDEPCAH